MRVVVVVGPVGAVRESALLHEFPHPRCGFGHPWQRSWDLAGPWCGCALVLERLKSVVAGELNLP